MKITVSGTLDEIYQKSEAIKTVTAFRGLEGWVLFQDDEEWKYIPIWDDRLCPVCESFAGRWVGSQIPIEFQYWRRLEKNKVYPNTHESYPHLRGECRCETRWDDYMFVLSNRLWGEMEEVSI